MSSKLCVLAISLALANLTWAQELPPSHTLETLTSTATEQTAASLHQSSAATQFSHEVLDVPFSRSLVNQQQLQQQDLQRIDDAISQVSGVYQQSNYGGGFWENFSFRGFGSDPNIGTQMIRNGLSVNRGINAQRDMVNIESLEFLKGPTAALHGRGEAGGLLNINSKKPQWQPYTELNLRANSLEKYRANLEHSNAVNDELAYRVAISHEDNQSFRDHVSNQRWFFSPQLSWKPSAQTQIDLDSEFTQYKGTFDRGVSTYNQQFIMDPETFMGEPNDGDHLQKDHFYQLRLKHQLNDVWQTHSAVSVKDAQLKGFSTEPRRIQADGRTLERQRRYRDNESDDILLQSQWLAQLQSPWAAHELLLSAEAGRMNYQQLQLRRNHSATHPNHIDVLNPSYGQYLPDLPLFIDTKERQRYVSLNLQDQMFFSDQWSVLLGARFDQVQQDFYNHLKHSHDGQRLQQTSPRVGVNYRIAPTWSIYSNYGQSFALNSGMDLQAQLFKPETGQSYEVGAKYQPNTQSLLSIALFHMDKKNVLTTDPLDPSFQVTAGEVSSQGLEIDVSSQITDQLALRAQYSYTKAQVEKDQDLEKGARLSNIPEHSASFSLDYHWYLKNAAQMGGGATAVYVGERSGHSFDNGFDLPDYTLIHLNAYYAPHSDLRYQLNLANLLDETYYSASYSDAWVQLGEPLNASLAVQWKF